MVLKRSKACFNLAALEFESYCRSQDKSSTIATTVLTSEEAKIMSTSAGRCNETTSVLCTTTTTSEDAASHADSSDAVEQTEELQFFMDEDMALSNTKTAACVIAICENDSEAHGADEFETKCTGKPTLCDRGVATSFLSDKDQSIGFFISFEDEHIDFVCSSGKNAVPHDNQARSYCESEPTEIVAAALPVHVLYGGDSDTAAVDPASDVAALDCKFSALRSFNQSGECDLEKRSVVCNF